MPPSNKTGTEGAASAPPQAQARVTDPVCGMKVDPATARHSHVHDGVTYYFCCDGCRAKFAATPAKYLAGATANAPAIDAGAARPAEQAAPLPHDGHGGRAMHAAARRDASRRRRGRRGQLHLPDGSRGARGGPRRVSEVRDGARGAACDCIARRDRVRLPDASRSCPGPSRQLSEMRDGAGAARRRRRRGAQS